MTLDCFLWILSLGICAEEMLEEEGKQAAEACFSPWEPEAFSSTVTSSSYNLLFLYILVLLCLMTIPQYTDKQGLLSLGEFNPKLTIPLNSEDNSEETTV